MKKRILFLVILLVLFNCLLTPAYAHEVPDTEQKGSICFTMIISVSVLTVVQTTGNREQSQGLSKVKGLKEDPPIKLRFWKVNRSKSTKLKD